MRKKFKYIYVIVLVLIVCLIISALIYFKNANSKNENNKQEVVITPSYEPTLTPTPTIDTTPRGEGNTAFSDTNSLLLANKKHKLPEGYEPDDLVEVDAAKLNDGTYMRKEAAEAIIKMFNAANKEGVYPVIVSAYRSEDYQVSVYNSYVNRNGKTQADTYSSRPGYSDHQTGLTADISSESNGYQLNTDFENTIEGQWLALHAHEYGFIMRYPKNKEEITGYIYEPWHFRYIGVDYATKLYETDPNDTFEEFFEVEGGDYENS